LIQELLRGRRTAQRQRNWLRSQADSKGGDIHLVRWCSASFNFEDDKVAYHLLLRLLLWRLAGLLWL
jgi:hypothetical protein